MYSLVCYLNFLIILLSCNLVHSSMDYLPKNWVDPHDMRRYDRVKKKMKSSEETKTSESAKNDNNCTKHSGNLERFEIFLERFVNHVLSTANLKNKVMKPNTRIASEIPILITSEELSRLIELGERITAANLNELDELFSSVFTNERGFSFDTLSPYLNPVEQLFFNLSYEKITVLVFIMVSSVVMWMFAVGRELKKIIIFLYLIFFLGGLAWNWWKMYQEAVIEQYTEMQRLSQIPDVCVPKKVGIFEYIFSTSSAQEECLKYNTAFRLNAFSKVPPTIVLSETISGMLVYPLKAVGSGVGEFLAGVADAAPWPLKYLFLPFIVVISVIALLCIVSVCSGHKISFWTLLGGLSIGGRSQNEAPSHPTLIDEISLRRSIENDGENNLIITQVGTIRRCITAVHNELSIEPPETNNFTSTLRRRFSPSIFRSHPGGDQLPIHDNRLSHRFIPSHSFIQTAAQNKSPNKSAFENDHFMPSMSHQAGILGSGNSTGEHSSSASGDNVSQNSGDIDQDIKNHWSNVLQQLNCNIKRKVPRIGYSRSAIIKKKYR